MGNCLTITMLLGIIAVTFLLFPPLAIALVAILLVVAIVKAAVK
jgi:hypothetical protein